jgi:hypothetical protein
VSNRDDYGRFLSPKYRELETMREEHGERDFHYTQAQRVVAGMMVFYPSAPVSQGSGWRRVAKVERIYKGVLLGFEDGSGMQRDLDGLVVLDCDDLPTALLIAKHSIACHRLGSNVSLKEIRQGSSG